LRVVPGETLGIVGASGAGKSTLLGLLLGFHFPTRGRLLLDGMDIRDVDLPGFRQRIAVVSQETLLFEGTVRENILHGVRGATEARLRAAVEDANAAEFIARLPRGLDTPLGERGARLSGGERQRIAIARALIRSPRVLVLDEATSALDVESEALVQDALDRLMEGRTTFIVAHRLSSLRRAERIAVLRDGRLVEMGSLSHLLSQADGEFARLQSQVFACVDRARVTTTHRRADGFHHHPEGRQEIVPEGV
ncbi:MAG: ATP-binding cassette domain-containing protein, partial [Gluconacetobacter diazotrophicus]|nr:ATP-binding cassette domain-containing protein [Gluconacetobacter diazotrophicus]